MKSNKYVEELKAKSAAELNEELVAAKKGTVQLKIPERNQSAGQHQQNQGSS